MSIGKNIRIYLDDGSVTGIRHAEIVNWTGQAISVPRTRISYLSEWEESKRPGIYFLYGIDEKTGSRSVYIGESENVKKRLQQHLRNKDFWNEAVFFTSKDENLTKSHVKYLESQIIYLAQESLRDIVINGTNPPLPILPRGDRDSMEEFIINLKILLGVIGHKTLEKLTNKRNKKEIKEEILSNNERRKNEIELFFKTKNLKAQAILTDEGLVVLTGSEATKTITKSLSGGYQEFRKNLIDNKVFKENNNLYVFVQDQLFSSPSQAAAIIVGYSSNGRKDWKTKSGKSIEQLESEHLTS